jgi:hypothetical protein
LRLLFSDSNTGVGLFKPARYTLNTSEMSEYADEIMLPEGGKDVEPDWVAAWEDCEVRRVGVTLKLGKDERYECSNHFYTNIYPDSY